MVVIPPTAGPPTIVTTSSALITGPTTLPSDTLGKSVLPRSSASLPSPSYDCLCADANGGYVSKPYTNCASYIQCSGGRMVQELSCPPEMIFDARVQACNWQGDTHQAVCEESASFEKDAACQCEYARTLCTRSLGDLTAETISTWEFPTDCDMADDICPTECAVTDDICSAGDKLYQEHKSDVCTWCIQPSCENGSPQSQSCIDQSTHCCGGLLPVCQCDVIEAECERGNGKSCSMYADIYVAMTMHTNVTTRLNRVL